MNFYTRSGDHLLLHIRLTPKADRDHIGPLTTMDDGKVYLTARVRALPDKGAANAALIGLLAKTLGLRKTDITIQSGAQSKLKCLRIPYHGDTQARLDALGDAN